MFHFPAFPPHRLCVQRRVTASSAAGFPHSETLGSQSGYRLPQAYRRFPRPSSAPDAKASTVRPWKLQHRRNHKGRTHTQRACTHLQENSTHHTHAPPHPQRGQAGRRGGKKLLDARVHYTVLKQQPPQPAPIRHHAARHRKAGTTPPQGGRRACCPRTQQCAKDPTPRIDRPATSSSHPHTCGGVLGPQAVPGARATNPSMFHP